MLDCRHLLKLLLVSMVIFGMGPVLAEALSATAFDASYYNSQLGSTVRILYDGKRYARAVTGVAK
jgi:hypothetical protein